MSALLKRCKSYLCGGQDAFKGMNITVLHHKKTSAGHHALWQEVRTPFRVSAFEQYVC